MSLWNVYQWYDSGVQLSRDDTQDLYLPTQSQEVKIKRGNVYLRNYVTYTLNDGKDERRRDQEN